MTQVSEATVRQALSRVKDPEINRPITEIGMLKSVEISETEIRVEIYLTIAGCPLKNTLINNTKAAVEEVAQGVPVVVNTDVMSDEQRKNLRQQLRGDVAEPLIPFAQPDSTTRVYAIASGKGGVGKSSTTVNLACALAKHGLKVGILDADIYGHSIPGMMGTTERPHAIDDMIMPPIAHGVKLISIAHFVEGNAPVVWRGPMLHRAIQQFLADVFWGDLDILLLDLPPGTGDIAISVAQLIPNAELIVVTTPQVAAAEVAERAGSISVQTRQKIAGVVENMSAMVLPDGSIVDVFGSGGGEQVSNRLSQITGTKVPLLGTIPLDPLLREGGDEGTPIVLGHPESATATAISTLAEHFVRRKDSLAGKSLGLGIKPRS